MKNYLICLSMLLVCACTDYQDNWAQTYGTAFANESELPSVSSEDSYSSLNVTSSESVVMGVMTDARDGKTYKIVTIGSQTWMAENLNYEVEGQSSCFNNSADSCAKYGRLYTWAAAMGHAEKACGAGRECNCIGTVRGVCPEGWHLPDENEWDTLYSAVERNPYALQAKGWPKWKYATDVDGFSALPVGSWSGNFSEVGSHALFWSATELGSWTARLFWLDVDSVIFHIDDKSYSHAVRCLQDEPGSLSETRCLHSWVYPDSVVRGSMTDSRDGKNYKIVTIGSQTWMAENLNYEVKNQSYCYINSVDSCAKYGRLYTWAAAVGVCPEGWHLPNITEWSVLYRAMGNDVHAMQAAGWSDAIDGYDFSALPAGGYYNGNFAYLGVRAIFWSSTVIAGINNEAYYWYVENDSLKNREREWEHYSDNSSKGYGYSVRCLKD